MNARRETAARMTDAAADLLGALDADQRAAASWPFPATEERELWFYTPTDHGGLPLAAMSSDQHRLTHRLVATGLSTAGYVTASTIMGLENVLDFSEGWTSSFERERGRDPLLYWIAVFGEPGSDAWGWRFGGHHISISHTIVGGEVVASTPLFFGADPASAPLLGPHPLRPLAGVEDTARELVRSLPTDQLSTALVAAVAPTDIIGGNRPVLRDGDEMLGLPDIWRSRFEGELDRRMVEIQRGAERDLGLTDEHLDALRLTSEPKGLTAANMSADHREALRAVLELYLDRLPDGLADDEKAKFDGDAIESLSFLWAGSTEPGEPHYYRIQGADLLVEYDNTQRDVNHVHAVWRDLRRDFGRDTLAEHYTGGHPHGP